jgi:hypothetical protein
MPAFEHSDALLKFALTIAKSGLPAFGGFDLWADGEE